ncbi:MAG TPA: hypothetical protein VGN74_04000 [Brevundimonas sp.]|jgi:hypothetical protein|uniref:hypothetical protein n=1 Tax=Brevundimonas sp. TaxID=1871086 RepID=UPI002E148F4A|nr:hypothetical protein [Brevundimonas sp.]
MQPTEMYSFQPQSVEEAIYVRKLYRDQIAKLHKALMNSNVLLDDYLRHIEEHGEPDRSKNNYYFKAEELARFKSDLQYQEAYYLNKVDGSVNIFYRTAFMCLSAMEIAVELQNDLKKLKRLANGLEKGRESANLRKTLAKNATNTELLLALRRLYEGGARYPTLDAWSNKVIEMLPHLSPPKGKPNGKLNHRISKLGRQTFGVDWPVKPRG